MSREGDKLAEMFQQPPAAIYPTGYAGIDNAFRGGLRAGQSTLVGGFTGHAKSAFAEQLALDCSVQFDVMYLSLEMGERMTRMRMGAKLARTSLDIFARHGFDLITQHQLNGRKLTVFCPEKRSISEIERIAKSQRFQIIIIDDCRNIDGVVMGGSRQTDAHAIANQITRIAETHGVHVVALHQLNPKTYRDGPMLWAFQDSTVFEQRAYNALTVFRPFANGRGADTVAEIRIRKNRNGPRAKLHYRWVGETMSFWEMNEAELEALECCKSQRARTA